MIMKNFFMGYQKSECWYKIRDGEGIFQIEEVNEEQSLGIGTDKFGCRYSHAIVDLSNNKFNHLDGAVRTYSTDEIRQRIINPINKVPGRTEYTKIFKVNGQFNVDLWKSLVSDYFQFNNQIVEYLGGKPFLNESYVESEYEEDVKSSICPSTLNNKEDLRISVSYHHLDEDILNKKRAIHNFASDENGNYVIENEFIEILKVFKRFDDELILTKNVKFNHFDDYYVNFPLIKHGIKDLEINLLNTFEAVSLVLEGMEEKDSDFTISLNIAWPTETKEVWLSILGYPMQINAWINKFVSNIPLNDNKIGSWLDNIGKWIYNINPHIDDHNFARILKPDGILTIQRFILNPSLYKIISQDGNTLIELAIPVEEKKIYDLIQSGEVDAALGYYVTKIICSKCGEDYIDCNHSKYMDSGVFTTLEKVDNRLAILTDKKMWIHIIR